MNARLEPTIALLLCGNLFEDFFDTIGVNFDFFRTEYTGSYMFNYIKALSSAGVRTVIFFISARVTKTLDFKHEPSGADVCILPAPVIHKIFRKLKQSGMVPNISITRSLDSYCLLPQKLLSSELASKGCSAILFQDYENPSFDVCVWLGQKIKIPVFATFQGANSPMSKLEKLIRPFTLRQSAGLIIASQDELQRVSTCYKVPNTKLKQIANPIDVAGWNASDRATARQDLGISLDAKVVVFHGRISINHKGLDILLKAWKLLCESDTFADLRLLIVGTGQDADKLREMIKAMNLTNVMWLDEFVSSREKIQKYLSAANVYTLPSRLEGFPVAPIEAMACQLPVVATEVAGIPEILGSGAASSGLMVPRENPEALAAALKKVLDNKVWAEKLGKIGRSRAEKYFSLEAIGQELRSVLLHQDSQ
ncbi:glycosyltransferase family 4 protein [Phormidium sp. LEGE 05292]|uniref:glycosyltransferase family 4 protein n=1 Tax=[Phormidium] sp. LEGE 05292 TaxID=767427 RepID=UPI00187E349C|nr:glycosyltransferase family 4 protein [Phormidium sp. LEGE 05292]MBE9228322.1 glycosyltransferase family 4 protein [Phormidium sp. LEGE 05292]